MSNVSCDAKGHLPALRGTATLDVGEFTPVEAYGHVPAPLGTATVVVYSGGNRAPFVYEIEPGLFGGLDKIVRGPGLLVAGAARKSRRVVMIDPTGFRRLTVAASTDPLGGEIEDIGRTDDHLFITLEDTESAYRRVQVYENTVDMGRVLDEPRGDTPDANWLIVNAEADLFAYANGGGRVTIRRASPPFDIVDTIDHTVQQGVAVVWTRYRILERAESLTDEFRRFALFIVNEHTGVAVAIETIAEYTGGEYVAYRSRVTATPSFRDLEAPVRLGAEGASVLQGGSVTNRGPIVPTFDGVLQIADGSWLTFWGYTSDNDAIADIPRSESGILRNHFIGRPADDQSLLPTLFAGGVVTGVVVLPTNGEAVTWELRGHPGGGIATTDYTKTAPDGVLALALFGVKSNPPTYYRYRSLDPAAVEQTSAARFDLAPGDRLNNAGPNFGSVDLGIHTRLPNDSIPGVTRWFERSRAARIEGGAIQTHDRAAIVSRALAPELDRELARGVLFNVPEFNITELPVNFADPADAQVGEQMGFEIGVNADGSVVCLSSELYNDPAFPYLRQGRVFVWLRNPDGSYRNTDIIYATDTGDPAWEPDANSAYFSRYTEVNPAGDRVFIGSKRGPGIAVFNIDENGKATFNKTLTWPAYLDQPKGSRAHEARFDVTGKFHFLTTARFSRSGGVQPGTFHVLYSDDNWETWEVRQAGQTRPGALPTDVDNFQTLDVSRDGTTFVIGAWEINRLYVFRSTDGWLTYKSYELTAPPGVTQYNSAVSPFVPSEERIRFGISNGCSYDGFRVVSACSQTWDYANGVPLPNVTTDQTGTAWYWLYEYDTDTYSGPYQIMPPIDIPNPSGNTRFGSPTRMNAPGFRFNLSVSAAGTIDAATFIYGIHDDEIRQIAELTGPYTVATADTRWTFDADLFIGSNKTADNPDSGETNVGAFRAYRVSEVP